MKIGIIGIEGIDPVKISIVDSRLDTLEKMFKSAKKTYLQVEIITDPDKLKEADGIIASENSKADLILSDLEFVELRLARGAVATEKNVLDRFKEHLDKEGLLSQLEITSEEEKKMVSAYSLLTVKPIYFTLQQSAGDKNKLLFDAYYGLGFICFFTAGEKESRAWSIKKGTTAWEASGCIHSAIQKGFIRAEVVAYDDFVSAGNIASARGAGKARLEGKEYVVQDGEYIEIRCSK
jgi:ribosome-binding ATPase YchF (GTP1/OBG family)